MKISVVTPTVCRFNLLQTAPLRLCNRCGRWLSRGSFYRNTGMKDGLLRQCKPCVNAYEELPTSRVRRRKNAMKRYYSNPELRAAVFRRAGEWRKRNLAAVSAHSTLGSAVADGRLVHQPCEVCGSSKTDAHHDDYAKPLDVRWLCRVHHKEHHADQD